MARICRHCREVGASFAFLASLMLAPVLAQGQNAGTDLYDRPVLAVDPGMHTAQIWSQAVDAAGQFAVTGGADRTVRVWSVADGKLLRTIWIPVGRENVGVIYAVAISPDGSTIAAAGLTEKLQGGTVIYLFDRKSGSLTRRIHGAPDIFVSLAFSPDGRHLAAGLGGANGLRVFDRDKEWAEAFRDDRYGDASHGAAFAPDGRLATTSYDGMIRLYAHDPNSDSSNFRLVGQPIKGPSGNRPRGIAFSPDGELLAVGYTDFAGVDLLDATTLAPIARRIPPNARLYSAGLPNVAWSLDGQTLYSVGGVADILRGYVIFEWDRAGFGSERRLNYCAQDTAANISALPQGHIFVASMIPCLGVEDANGRRFGQLRCLFLIFAIQAKQSGSLGTARSSTLNTTVRSATA